MVRRLAPMGSTVQRRQDGIVELLDGQEAAVGKVLVFDLAPDRFDQVQLRTVGWDEEERDAGLLERGAALLDELRVVDRVIVQHDDAGAGALVAVGADLGQARHLLLDELQMRGRIVFPLVRAPRGKDQPRAGRIERRPGPHHVDAAAGRSFVADERALAPTCPGIAGGQGRREPALVQIE